MAPKRINCPTCGKEFDYERVIDVATFPFCCERCRWGDLDRWFDAEHRISRDITDEGEGGSVGPNSQTAGEIS